MLKQKSNQSPPVGFEPTPARSPVVGPTPPQVRRAVDQPGGVERADVSEYPADEQSGQRPLVPQPHRDSRGHGETQQHHQNVVVSEAEIYRSGGKLTGGSRFRGRRTRNGSRKLDYEVKLAFYFD